MLTFLIVLLLLLIAVYWSGFTTDAKEMNDRPSQKTTAKPVVVLVVDSLMDKPLKQAIQSGRAPALQFFMEKGTYYPEMISSYPTMSVTIDSTILTGTYADEHKLPGLVWYDQADNRIINYGSARGELVRLGLKNAIKDGVYRMNHHHLSRNVQTVHEELHRAGRQSASINGMIYRGDIKHPLAVPRALSRFNFLPEELVVEAPDLFVLGSLSHYDPINKKNAQAWQSFGMNDAFTVQELKNLVHKGKLPSFTLAYLPDLDKPVHQKGANDLKGIEKVDKELQKLLDSFDSWEEAKEKVVWVIMGDSGQTPVKEKHDNALIKLPSLSEHFTVEVGTGQISKEDQLVLALNERMAYIYLLDDDLAYEDVLSRLESDERIGWIAWKDDEVNHVQSGQTRLRYSKGGDLEDEYGVSWKMEGDPTVLDLFINGDQKIKSGDYPDALSRLYGALHSQEGRFLIVDAKPGYEFATKHSPTHAGGASHGSLYWEDSLAPMIVVGTDERPATNRHVDLKDWFLQLTK